MHHLPLKADLAFNICIHDTLPWIGGTVCLCSLLSVCSPLSGCTPFSTRYGATEMTDIIVVVVVVVLVLVLDVI